MELQTVKVHGHDVAYRTGGSGPVVLLIHGMAGSSTMWKPAIPWLSEHVTYIAPDLPGHGRSDKPRADYSLGAQASFLRDLLATLGHDRVTVVGQSLGGGIALQFAYQHPEYCERLGLVCAGGLGDEVSPILRGLTLPGAELVMPLVFQPIIRDAINLFAGAAARIGLRPDPVTEQMWRSYCSLLDGDARRAFVHTLRSVVDIKGQRVSAHDKLYLASALPTLIIWGDQDPIIPVDHALEAFETIDNSRLEIFEGAGHFPHCEQPEHFAKVLLDFVATTDAVRLEPNEFAQRLAAATS